MLKWTDGYAHNVFINEQSSARCMSAVQPATAVCCLHMQGIVHVFLAVLAVFQSRPKVLKYSLTCVYTLDGYISDMAETAGNIQMT